MSKLKTFQECADLINNLTQLKNSPIPIAPSPDWTEDDASNWKSFLKTPSGQALWIRARAMEAATCIKACAGQYDPKMAGGISFTMNWLEQLANAETISSASLDKDANNSADTLENVG